ncbi:MAG TPA: efflux RND transporter permease subunit [Candidatus Hydrogenedentes bacterium]|nr:efflux RND transporter permease subunit [Candidatus Hydrogenedentota bacterium]HOS01999.1 efflux RND transporter permease subunit [Candidatus Hydrogenedentota bacterium]
MSDRVTGQTPLPTPPRSWIDRILYFCLSNKLIVALLVALFVGWGVAVAPFDWNVSWMPRFPVAVDAIPDIGENQQIVFTPWEGRSPQDIEDQITYPLSAALLGIPGVKTIRGHSYFGFSTLYVIFEENIEFYWSRSRVLEKLSSLPDGSLPEGVRPTLGPDATGLGQVYMYTLEGRDPEGRPVGGWDSRELRTVQDYHVRYALLGAGGVSEVSSVGGYVQEYQIDVDPAAMRMHGVSIEEAIEAVRKSNLDVGASTIEVNRVEYLIRGRGFLKSLSDIENTVVKSVGNTPLYIKNIAHVSLGPEMRRGVLDKGGAEAAGGIVVVRYGANPLEVIKRVKQRIDEIASSLPVKAVLRDPSPSLDEVDRFAAAHAIGPSRLGELDQAAWLAWLAKTSRDQWPPWITTSQVTIVPFYDRTGLIYETLGTLNAAIFEQILVTIIVVIVMVMHLRSSILISLVLPLAVLICFIAMKLAHVDANIVALSGIAIAIGTLVDMGIIICENILKHLKEAPPEEDRLHVIYRASSEVGSAIVTAVGTTLIGFLPVFTMTGPEGKLFRPLAFTKTFALAASVIVALTILPALAHALFTPSATIAARRRKLLLACIAGAGIALAIVYKFWLGALLVCIAGHNLIAPLLPARLRNAAVVAVNLTVALLVGIVLTMEWLPLGPHRGMFRNLLFVVVSLGGVLGFFYAFQFMYAPVLRWCLRHKAAYLSIPAGILVFGYSAWLGFDAVFGFIPEGARFLGIAPETIRASSAWSRLAHKLPGFGKEFMPALDEGSFLYMPTTMPHASLSEALEVIAHQDRAISAIPEIESVVGKLGRADSALDPAPISMIETVINYKSEYKTDAAGRRLTFRFDAVRGDFARDANGDPIPDPLGRPYRQWRDSIRSPDDIWEEIVAAAQLPSVTSAPKLQPIAARIVMLQSGMRAPMGVKIKGTDLQAIENVGLDMERFLREVPGVEPDTVIADRIVGNPYLEIDIDRPAIARYGLAVRDVQDVIEMAIGGMPITATVEGRQRFPVRIRYLRELRDNIEALGATLVPAMDGAQIPLAQLADIRYVRGPMVIKSEDNFLVGYVLFDKQPGHAEVDVVENAQRLLAAETAAGRLAIPAGVSYAFAGSYENQLHAQKTLAIVLPLSMGLMFLILYFQFRSATTSFIVFSGILVAWGGGMILVWLYNQPWFLDVTFLGVNLRDLFQVRPINLSVAVWVGFIALFGVAEDDGVVIATYLDQSFEKRRPASVEEIREATLAGGVRRIRACLMTSSTTILALLPVFTSTGRGSDIMIPMAIPSFGGMMFVLLTLFMVPVLYCWHKEWMFQRGRTGGASATESVPATGG